MQRYPELKLYRDAEVMLWKGTIALDDRPMALQVRYPEWYPEGPPQVLAFDDEGQVVDYLDTWHTLLDGSPCLFTHGEGPDAWHANYTAADAVDRFVEFAQTARAGAHVRVYSGVAPEVPGLLGPGLALVPRTLAADLACRRALKPSIGRLEAWLSVDQRRRPIVGIHTLHGKKGHTQAAGEAERVLLVPGDDIEAIWLRWPERPAALWAPDACYSALVDMVRSAVSARAADALRGVAGALLSWRERGAERLAWYGNPGPAEDWLSALLPGGGLLRAPVHIVDGADQLGVRNADIVGRAAADAWAEVHLLMVGAGSLGSTVAVELAKAGARHFTIIDPDILRPENLSRHIAGREALFRPKVEAVADRILAHNPLAEVLASAREAPGGDGAPHIFRESLHRQNTLLIVTTAEGRSEAAINQMALEAGVTAIYGSVLGPAAHGRVFRVVPRRTPCLRCVTLTQRREPARSPRFEVSETASVARAALPAGRYRQPALPGVSIDVTRVALLVARMALGTLGCVHEGITYPDPGHDHVICTQHGGWVFNEADYAVRPISLTRQVDCPACGE